MKRTVPMVAALGLFLFAQAAQADWTPAKRLTWTSGKSSVPAAAADSNGAVHIVWEDNTPGNSEIYYKRSPDGGTTWTAAQRLTWNSGESIFPAIAIDPGNTIHVVWQDSTPGIDEIYYTRSSDGGLTWSAVRRLTWTSGSSGGPNIAIDSSPAIHIVWMDYTPSNYEVYYTNSMDAGLTWGPARRLTWTTTSSFYPVIASYSTHYVHVVWYDDTSGNLEVYYKRSWDRGSTWGTAKRLTVNSGLSGYPFAAAGSIGDIHIVWQDDTPGNQEIYYRRSTDGGSNWDTVRRLTWTLGWSYFPAMGIDSNDDIHIVWHDDTPGDSEIYYKSSLDGGSTWSATQRLTWMSGSSVYPAMAIGTGDALHLVWSDGTPGNYEIYYRKGS